MSLQTYLYTLSPLNIEYLLCILVCQGQILLYFNTVMYNFTFPVQNITCINISVPPHYLYTLSSLNLDYFLRISTCQGQILFFFCRYVQFHIPST